MLILRVFILAVLLQASLGYNTVHADFNSGLDAIAITTQYIMADPPLPAREHKAKGHTTKIKPGYITGKTKAHYSYGGGAYSDQSGSASGYTLGASYSYGVTSKVQAYGWMVGINLEGDFETKVNGESTPSIFSKNVDAQVLNLSFGINYSIYNKEEKGYGLSLFAGPYIPIYWYKQHYINENESFEADLESNEIFFGLLVGAQWDYNFNENWGVQPFVLFGDTFGSNDFFNPFGNSGECRSYKVRNTVSGNFETAQLGEIDCDNKKEFLYDTQLGGIGLNLSYKPWGVLTNLFVPFLNSIIFDVFYEGEEPDLLYLSFTWSI